ncbi:hypothetical protein, partial [Streptomyces sp. DSM 41978]|uniref:hypothetical protein n=1 Tax=Streptomyces sp. DSM 41978 TaxID=3448658 RepID=UPI00404020F9
MQFGRAPLRVLLGLRGHIRRQIRQTWHVATISDIYRTAGSNYHVVMAGAVSLEIDGLEVAVSNPDKVVFP